MRTFAPAKNSHLALRFWPVLAYGWLLAAPVCAQFNATTVNAPTSAFLPARRELKQVLSSAAKAIADERYAEAAGTLGDLLKDPDFEDYFTDAKGRASLKGEAQELVRSLPKLGRESYELQYGADARKLLNTALDEGDDAKLADVVRLYFHTKAGYEAAYLLARQQLDAGQPLLAAMLFQRLLETSPYASQYDPELSLLTAISWRMAQRPDDAQAVLLALQKRQPNAVLQLGEQKVPMFAASENALAWLDKHLGQQVQLTSPLAAQWTMHRGDAARNAHTSGSLPLAMFRWHKYLGRDESDDERLLRSAKRYQSEGVAAIPTVSPLVINNQVLMRTPDLLMAVDLQTGKFVWRYPRHDDPNKPIANGGINRGPSAADRRDKELEQRVWRDSAYGQLACDNESVYLLEDLGFPTMSNVPSVLMLPGGARQRNPGQPANVNTLVALSHTKQGKLRWIVGGETGEGEPKLAGAFFLGVPLVHEGRLYAMVEINGELRLTVLDAATGNLLWSQQLAHVDTMTITVDYQRRLAGATPSLADGVLVCPTSASSVVAIDIIERKLLWGYRYTPSPNRPSVNWYGQIQQPKDVGTHWLDAGAIIAQGRVLLTPTESDELICLDLLTGKPAWKPRSRDDDLSNMLYVAGVEQDQILLVGRSRIIALKLADGTPAWNAPLQLSGEYPSGRGYFADGYYYLPTTQAQLLKIDTKLGLITARTAMSRVLGNLVSVQDQLISQNYDGLTAYYQSEALRADLVKRLRQNPADPVALAQQGQLLLHDGQGDAALQMLRKAYNLDRTNDDTRSLLVRTLLDALKRDFASYQDIAGEVEPLLDQPQQRRDFLRLKAIGLQQAGDRVGAFTTLVSLAQLDGSERSESPIAGLMTDSTDAQLRVRFDRWVAARLMELYRDSPEEDRAKLDVLVANQWEVPPANSTAQTWDGLLNHYGWHRSSDLARVELATLRLEAGELLAAETLLMQFPTDARDLLAGRATALLAAIYEKAGRRDFAADQYRRLIAHWSDVVVRHDKTGRQLYEQAAQTQSLGRVLSRATQWPGGQIKLSEGADVVASGSNFSVYQRIYPVPFIEAHGTLAQGAALQFGVSGNQLTLRDALGNDINQFSLRRPDSRATIAPQTGLAHAHAVGHLLLVSLGQEVVAVDALKSSLGATDPSEATLWRQDLLPVPSNGSGGLQPVKPQIVPFTWALPRTITMYEPDKVIGAVAAMSERAVCYARLRDIACVDPLTGNILWERSQTEPGSDLFGDGELLFVVPPRTDEATVLSVADGRLLGKRRVDRLDFRWATCGRNVLSCKQDGREFIVTLYDAWSEKTLWESRFNFGSRGTLIGRDEMAMMQPDGKLVVVSLATGRVIIDTQLAPEPRLLNIFVVRSSQQYFVQMDTIIEAKDSASGVSIQPAPGGEYTKIVTGRLYAFNRVNGQPAWQSPAYISQFGLLLDQPTELPLLFFLRHKQPTSARGPDKQQTSLMALDRRDGSLVLARDNIPIQQTNYYELAGNRNEDSITISLASNRGGGGGSNAKLFTFKLTDDPAPPEPPAQTGAAASAKAEVSVKRKLGTFSRIIGDALRGPLPAEKDLPEFPPDEEAPPPE